jgi:hypothetical protein
VVILTFDTSVGGFWLTDYFPEILEVDRRTVPALSAISVFSRIGSLEGGVAGPAPPS